jgi:DNA-binding PadR family transcriptional regulator
MKGITNELIGASASSMILSFLKEGDSYGYELIQKMRELTEGKIKWQEATIYPILKKMENEDLIKSYWKFNEGERARKYYKILDKGVKKLFENRDEWKNAELIFDKIFD